MTLEEFKKKLKLKYTFGVSRTDGASRRYHDSEMNIGAECHTSKNKNGKWGKSEMIYYFENSDKEYNSLEELYKQFKNNQTKGEE